MLISAVLKILSAPEVPRRGTKSEPVGEFPEVSATESPPRPAVASLSEARQQNLQEASIVRPLLPEVLLPFSNPAGASVGDYVRALDRLGKPLTSHTVDLFE